MSCFEKPIFGNEYVIQGYDNPISSTFFEMSLKKDFLKKYKKCTQEKAFGEFFSKKNTNIKGQKNIKNRHRKNRQGVY